MSFNINTQNYNNTIYQIETLVKKGPKYILDALALVDSIEDQSFKDKAHARITELSLQRLNEQFQPVKPKKLPIRRIATTKSPPQCKATDERKTIYRATPAAAPSTKGTIVHTSLRALDPFLSTAAARSAMRPVISYQLSEPSPPPKSSRRVIIPQLDLRTKADLAAIASDGDRGDLLSATRDGSSLI